MKIGIVQLQFALVFQNIYQRPDQLGSRILAGLGDIYDKIPNIMSLPDNAPVDIPIVNLSSNDPRYTLSISKTRLDVFFNFISSVDDVKNNHSQAFVVFDRILEIVAPLGQINRVGIVGNFHIDSQNPEKLIHSKFMNPKLKAPHELTLRMNSRSALDVFTINNIVEYNSNALLVTNGNASKGFITQVDINTLPLTRPIELAEFREFVEYCKFRLTTEAVERGLK